MIGQRCLRTPTTSARSNKVGVTHQALEVQIPLSIALNQALPSLPFYLIEMSSANQLCLHCHWNVSFILTEKCFYEVLEVVFASCSIFRWNKNSKGFDMSEEAKIALFVMWPLVLGTIYGFWAILRKYWRKMKKEPTRMGFGKQKCKICKNNFIKTPFCQWEVNFFLNFLSF